MRIYTNAPSRILYLFAATLLFVASCALDPSMNKQPTEIPDISAVEVDSMHQTCELPSDCVLVYVDCSSCDCGVSVNYFYEDYYVDLYEEICSDYEGPVCEMYCPPSTLICQSGFCGIELSD